MPSFAQTNKDSMDTNEEVSMEDVFSAGQGRAVLNQLLQSSRLRAKKVLQTELPEYILHLNRLLESAEQDESSALWKGHLQTGPFVKDNVKLFLSSKDSDGPPAVPNKSGLNAGKPTNLEQNKQIPNDPKSSAAASKVKGSDVESGDDVRGDEEGEEDATKGCWKGRLPRNEICDRLVELLQEEVYKGVMIGRNLVHWLKLESPTMEDGNNFGVEVQDNMMRLCQSLRSNSWDNLTFPKNRYYADRRGIATTWCRYPNLEDHAAAIATSDRQWFYLVHTCLHTQRINAVHVLDALQKNWVKASDPKNKKDTDGRSAMY